MLMNPRLYAQCAMRLTKPETLLDQRKVYLRTLKGGGASGKEPTGQYRRRKSYRFNPWIRKIPWRRAWQPIPIFLPGESHGQRSLLGYTDHSIAESYMTEVNSHACKENGWLMLLQMPNSPKSFSKAFLKIRWWRANSGYMIAGTQLSDWLMSWERCWHHQSLPASMSGATCSLSSRRYFLQFGGGFRM